MTRKTNLETGDSAWRDETSTMVGFRAVGDDLSFDVSNEAGRIRRSPEAEVVLSHGSKHMLASYSFRHLRNAIWNDVSTRRYRPLSTWAMGTHHKS
jgi:hypothetical protein